MKENLFFFQHRSAGRYVSFHVIIFSGIKEWRGCRSGYAVVIKTLKKLFFYVFIKKEVTQVMLKHRVNRVTYELGVTLKSFESVLLQLSSNVFAI